LLLRVAAAASGSQIDVITRRNTTLQCGTRLWFVNVITVLTSLPPRGHNRYNMSKFVDNLPRRLA